jgi:hypothetical protein
MRDNRRLSGKQDAPLELQPGPQLGITRCGDRDSPSGPSSDDGSSNEISNCPFYSVP